MANYSEALEHFKKVDRVLYQAAKSQTELEEIVPAEPSEYLTRLCETIVSQQLSTKVAATIWSRVLELFSEQAITSESILRIEDEVYRQCGLSYSKIKYVKNLAGAAIEFEGLREMEDEQIAKVLTEVKGVGPWTVEMFLIFDLGRSDVFSKGDLGLRNAILRLPGLREPEVWSPYRSYASRVLWKTLG